MKLTYIQTIKLALAIAQTSNTIEQTAGILAITKHGDEKAIIDGRLKKLVDFGRWMIENHQENP